MMEREDDQSRRNTLISNENGALNFTETLGFNPLGNRTNSLKQNREHHLKSYSGGSIKELLIRKIKREDSGSRQLHEFHVQELSDCWKPGMIPDDSRIENPM